MYKKYKNYKKSKMTKNIKRKSKNNRRKSRKNKKSGLKVIEEDNYTKKNTRWKQNKSKYDSLKKNSCDDISNYVDLINKLKKNFVNNTGLQIKPYEYTLFPYCNENLKSLATLDKVNAPFTSSLALYSLHDVFKCEFSANYPAVIKGDYRLVENLSKSNGAKSPNNDPEKFFELIKNINRNCFIVSHSGFMTKLYDYIKKIYKIYDDDKKTYDSMFAPILRAASRFS